MEIGNCFYHFAEALRRRSRPLKAVLARDGAARAFYQRLVFSYHIEVTNFRCKYLAFEDLGVIDRTFAAMKLGAPASMAGLNSFNLSTRFRLRRLF